MSSSILLDETRPCESASRKTNRYTRKELETILESYLLKISDKELGVFLSKVESRPVMEQNARRQIHKLTIDELCPLIRSLEKALTSQCISKRRWKVLSEREPGQKIYYTDVGGGGDCLFYSLGIGFCQFMELYKASLCASPKGMYKASLCASPKGGKNQKLNKQRIEFLEDVYGNLQKNRLYLRALIAEQLTDEYWEEEAKTFLKGFLEFPEKDFYKKVNYWKQVGVAPSHIPQLIQCRSSEEAIKLVRKLEKNISGKDLYFHRSPKKIFFINEYFWIQKGYTENEAKQISGSKTKEEAFQKAREISLKSSHWGTELEVGIFEDLFGICVLMVKDDDEEEEEGTFYCLSKRENCHNGYILLRYIDETHFQLAGIEVEGIIRSALFKNIPKWFSSLYLYECKKKL